MRQQARAGDVIAAADPRCLGHSLQEVLAVLLEALQRGIRISLPGIGAIGPADEEPETVLRLAAAIDRSLSASRTGAAVAARKAAGKRVGRPSGTRNQLMLLDGRRDELARLLSLGLSKSKAADALGVHRNSLRAYLLQKPLG
jgi:DNA invertase Pin-like site-specific DNA recombinase